VEIGDVAAGEPRRPEQVEQHRAAEAKMRRAGFLGHPPPRDKEHHRASPKCRRESTPQTHDVKGILSAIVLIVAAGLAFWSGSPIRHDFSIFVVVVAILMIAAMWVFPEAGVKKGDVKRAK
jgi:hypothetical protein